VTRQPFLIYLQVDFDLFGKLLDRFIIENKFINNISDPNRESTITAVYRLLKARERIVESYKRIKGALKKLQNEYLSTKDTVNLISRYSAMKEMVREVFIRIKLVHKYCCLLYCQIVQVVTLEKQYWVLIDVPKQDFNESQVDYITR